MNRFSSLTDADHIVKWQVNFTHVLESISSTIN